MDDEETVVCPSPEDLEVSGSVQCPVEGCGKELPSSACLRMHVIRRHHGKRLERASDSLGSRESLAFYCPEEGCKRSKKGGEPFAKLGQLKQHYQTMHGEKSHLCSECGKRFAMRDVCSRHEQECRQKIVCATCGLDFRSRNALYQHSKRKGHPLPSRTKQKSTKLRASTATPAVNVVFVPVPTSLKLVLPVPRRGQVVCSSTQTDIESPITPGGPLDPQQGVVELQSSSSQTTPSLLSPSFFNHALLLNTPSDIVTPDTQIPHLSSSPVVSMQPHSTQLCDFGTQTQLDTNSTPLALSQPTTVNSCYNTPPLDLVEFGTQTPTYSAHYGICESDTVDFGTQTIRMSDLEIDDSLFCRNLLPPECLDFGTQTLDYTYDCSSHTCPHGTSDTRDQSSQTQT